MLYYGHSKEGLKPEDWQPLEEHLKNVAHLAADFAKPFGGEGWASLSGLWYDLGKYSSEFQIKMYKANGYECHLETKPGRVIHSQAGGHLAQKRMSGGLERVFCWLIMGHHTGLADYSSADSGAKALEPKMRDSSISDEILCKVPEYIRNQVLPSPPQLLRNGADVAFFIRMLFSCLVDADFLDTEIFMDEKRQRIRKSGRGASLDDLLITFDSYMDEKCETSEPLPVNRIRADVLEQCRRAGEKESTVFSLTVPTGGGKTLSSLAFALQHAKKWNKRRIIYVIPYTSIIEQTASVFQSIPGFENSVLEHHSNVWDDDETTETVHRRLASENWDAPIVVTTAVQFFESLYANKTSRCRKLHNIIDSVVIFDEAQCLPPEYLRPIVFAIRELHRHYGMTPLLCTATQPVLTKTENFDFKFREGFDTVVEIIEDPVALSISLERVKVEPMCGLNPVGYEDLTEAILSECLSVLCIVNRKSDARQIAELLPDNQTIHLSTNMCAAHRMRAFRDIRKLLDNCDKPLFVVSTSLVEAGVDLDFPVVYRALAGLDSIAQAAGRCNREGRIEKGRTIVFVPENQPDYVRSAASLARGYLAEDRIAEVFTPTTIESYFHERFFLLGQDALDKKGLLKLLDNQLEFAFRSVAERFRMIDDGWQLPLIVPFGEAPETVDRLLDWDARSLFRKLQRYTINVPKEIMWQLIDEGHARELPGYPGTCYLDNKGLYTKSFGFVPPDEFDAYSTDLTIT